MFVLWGFVTVQLTLSVGWVVIKIHEWQMQRKAMRNVLKAIKMGTDVDDLQAAINYEKSCLAAEKTWWQRILSWKALHGTLFFTSWVNIVGRIFFTPWNPDEWQCYTYPYYKPIDVPTKYNGSSVGELVPVPITDPRMENFPQYQITVMYSVGSIIGCFAVGTIYSCVAAAYHKRNKRTGSISDDKHRHQSSLPLAYSSLPEATIPAAPATTDY